MKQLEKILLSKVPVWTVVVMFTLTVAGAVLFGAIVKSAAQRGAQFFVNVSSLGRVAVRIADIPKTFFSLLQPNLCITMTNPQRFDGQAGLRIADAGGFSGREEEGGLLLTRYVSGPWPWCHRRDSIIPRIELIDLNSGTVVHVWRLGRRRFVPFQILPDGSLVGRSGDFLLRMDVCSNVEWQKRLKVHHSIEMDADGNFWAPLKVEPSTVSGASSKFRDHGLLRFSPSGEVLSRISLSDILVRGGYRHLLYAVKHYEYDPLHINDVEPVLQDGLIWRRGDLFVSLRTNSVVFLYRPTTDDVVWLQSGPWLHQHDVDVVSESEISIFSNNAIRANDGRRQVLGANEVYIYDFATGEARSPWREAMKRHEVRTVTKGAATLFDDGGVMVEEHNYGRVLRLSADGEVRWSYVNRASDGRVYQLARSLYVDAKYGTEVTRSAAACTSSNPQARTTH